MKKKKIYSLALLLVSLPFLLLAGGRAVMVFLQAREEKANIVVDTASNLGEIEPIWQALAQGGEEKDPFTGIENQMAALRPRYIRIDHLYDFYDVVSRSGEQLVFNWTKLDAVVNQILAAGAKPFLSLSYMPPVIAQNGDITSPPVNWADWQAVVRATVQHFSGRNERNLTGVIYEVWNEPDLFGNWKIGYGERDYLLLYRYAVAGAAQIANANPFQIGGPSTTAPYQNWVGQFLAYVVTNNLRLDFYSWHRYALATQAYLEDVNRIDTWLFENAGHTLPKYLTEWGPDPKNSPLYDNAGGAAHLVATIPDLLQRVDMAFVFEIKDGPDPAGKKFWGRWGLLTHQSAGPVTRKPRYFALQFLNQAIGVRLRLSGQTQWIKALAVRSNNTIKLILVNFDLRGRHFENVPVVFENLPSGTYQYQETYLHRAGQKTTETVPTWTLLKQIPLRANEIVLVELTKI